MFWWASRRLGQADARLHVQSCAARGSGSARSPIAPPGAAVLAFQCNFERAPLGSPVSALVLTMGGSQDGAMA
jgi:hypothetical protein